MSIVECIKRLIRKSGGIPPPSNDICENLVTYCDSLGNGEGTLIVTVTNNGSTYSTDKTFDEISTAIKANKSVMLKYATQYFVLGAYDGSSSCVFTANVLDSTSITFYTCVITESTITFSNKTMAITS